MPARVFFFLIHIKGKKLNVERMKWNFCKSTERAIFRLSIRFLSVCFRRNESVARNFSPRLLLTLYKRGKTYSQSPLSSGSFDFPLYKLPRACASLPLVVRFIFVWIPREKPRVNLAAFRVTVWVKRERREREKKSQEKVGGGIREEEKEKGRISPG